MREACPNCGSRNTVSSTSGSMCKDCGHEWMWIIKFEEMIIDDESV